LASIQPDGGVEEANREIVPVVTLLEDPEELEGVAGLVMRAAAKLMPISATTKRTRERSAMLR